MEADHISVCVPTYMRPKLLGKLLEHLFAQKTNGLFVYSITVVDNDENQSAKSVVESFKERAAVDIHYYSEPIQNIALVRNKAVEESKGNLIAFIDDDEFPTDQWLLNLYNTLRQHKAGGVLGPVKPFFEKDAPGWIIKSKICERPTHETGTVLHWGETRTGNVLLDRKIFEDSSHRFEPEFGRTGGEDIEFFKKMMDKGFVFIWCNESPAYEVVPAERWKRTFYLKKNLRIGGLTGEKYRKRKYNRLAGVGKSMVLLLPYTVVLFVSIPFGSHQFIKFLSKVAYHFGVISGFFGVVFYRYR